MKTKYFGILFALIFILIVSIISSSCAKEEPTVEESVIKAKPEQKPLESIVYSREDPGPWAGKENGHLPQITWEKTETGIKVTVSVNHEMNAEKPHYIMWIRLWDDQAQLLGEKEFQPDNEKAEAVFEVDGAPAGLKAYEKCNLHGIWMAVVELQ